MSEDGFAVERFSLSENELELRYEITFTDPGTLTAPSTKFWGFKAVPGIEIEIIEADCSDDPYR